jgi:hypothetical protein
MHPCPRIALGCGALLLIHAVLLTIALLDFNRPDIRAACPAFAPFVATLVLSALAQLVPVVTLSHHRLPASPHRLAINATWLLLVVALLVAAHTQDRRLRDSPCFDEIYRPRPDQITGSAAVIHPVAFFVFLMQAVLALLYAIFVYQDIRLLQSVAPAPAGPAP